MFLIKKNLILYIILLNFLSLNNVLADKNCSNINISGKIKNLIPQQISVKTLDSRKWTKNLLKMLTKTKNLRKSEYISLDEYRDYHDAKIIVDYEGGIKCSYNGEVKIHGGTRNHRDNMKQTTSLRIRIFDGNILNTTHFALLLPKTRNGDNEIFGATLFKELGYISPLSFYTTTTVNEIGSYKVIFQSREDSEVLFFNRRREGTILSGNKTRGNKKFSLARISHIYDYGNNSYKKNFEILDKLNLIYLLNFEKFYLDYFEGIKIDKIKEYEILVSSMGGSLEKEDRKFYFNNLENILESIYNDTDLRILDKDFSYTGKDFFSDKVISNVSNKLNNINLDILHKKIIRNGLNISKKEISVIIKKIQTNIKSIRNKKLIENSIEIEKSLNNEIINNYLKILSDNKIGFIFYKINNTFILCKKINKCKKLDLSDKIIKNILSSHYIDYDNYRYKYISIDQNIIFEKKFDFGNYSKNNYFNKKINVDDFEIFYDRKADININRPKKIIEITFNDKNGKILIKDTSIKNWKFVITSNESLTTKLKKKISKVVKDPNDNKDIGCMTFSNVHFKNTSIFISNLGCKNSVHIIGSKGEINELQGEYLSNDAFDIDFSNLKIKNIKINQAGSECMSLKTGNYNFKKLSIQNCIHGVSIGENGKLEIDKFESMNSETALTVKDGSELILKKALIDNVDYCIKAFRKVTMFDYSKINFDENSLICNANKKNISKDNFSEINKIF
jgi:hypothetical protein